jgi:hypothetical protein
LGLSKTKFLSADESLSSISIPILPASFPKGTSSKLLSLQNNPSNLEPSDIHILLNLFSVNYQLSGKSRELLNEHLFLRWGSNSLKISSNKTGENVKNI